MKPKGKINLDRKTTNISETNYEKFWRKKVSYKTKIYINKRAKIKIELIKLINLTRNDHKTAHRVP